MRLKAIIIFFALVVSFIFYILNRHVPFFSDDLGWANMLNDLSFCDSIKCIYETQYNHWLTQNGRFTCHAVLQILAGNGDFIYDIGISLIFFLSLLVTEKLLNPNNSIWVVCIVVIAFLYLSPDSASNFYWAAGGCNYLLPVLLSCLYLLILREAKEKTISNWQIPFLSFFSFLAGWSHEIFALPIAFALFCCIIKMLLENGKKAIPIQLWLLIISYWVGALMIIVSPGTINRIIDNGGVESGTFLSMMMARFVTSFKIFRYGRFFYLLLVLVTYLLFSRKHSLRSFVIDNYFLLLCCATSLAIVIVLRVGGRAVWGVEVFSLLLLLNWFDKQFVKKQNIQLLNRVGVIIAIMIIVHQICLIKPFKESWDTYRAVVDQTKQSTFEGTARMEKWHSDNPLINTFVAHPYEMMIQDTWMRNPLHCNVCSSDVYDYLAAKKMLLDSVYASKVGSDVFIPYSERIVDAIRNDSFIMKLSPISYAQNDSFFYLTWHQLLQKLWPERYPTQISTLFDDEYSVLSIGGVKYIRFEKPVRPVFRIIEDVYVKY